MREGGDGEERERGKRAEEWQVEDALPPEAFFPPSNFTVEDRREHLFPLTFLPHFSNLYFLISS